MSNSATQRRIPQDLALIERFRRERNAARQEKAKLSTALQELSDAVAAYGTLDTEDVESAEWDTLLETAKQARVVLEQTR